MPHGCQCPSDWLNRDFRRDRSGRAVGPRLAVGVWAQGHNVLRPLVLVDLKAIGDRRRLIAGQRKRRRRLKWLDSGASASVPSGQRIVPSLAIWQPRGTLRILTTASPALALGTGGSPGLRSKSSAARSRCDRVLFEPLRTCIKKSAGDRFGAAASRAARSAACAAVGLPAPCRFPPCGTLHHSRR